MFVFLTRAAEAGVVAADFAGLGQGCACVGVDVHMVLVQPGASAVDFNAGCGLRLRGGQVRGARLR